MLLKKYALIRQSWLSKRNCQSGVILLSEMTPSLLLVTCISSLFCVLAVTWNLQHYQPGLSPKTKDDEQYAEYEKVSELGEWNKDKGKANPKVLSLLELGERTSVDMGHQQHACSTGSSASHRDDIIWFSAVLGWSLGWDLQYMTRYTSHWTDKDKPTWGYLTEKSSR